MRLFTLAPAPPSYQSKGSTKGEWLKLRMSTVAEGKIVPLALEKFNRELLGTCVSKRVARSSS